MIRIAKRESSHTKIKSFFPLRLCLPVTVSDKRDRDALPNDVAFIAANGNGFGVIGVWLLGHFATQLF